MPWWSLRFTQNCQIELLVSALIQISLLCPHFLLCDWLARRAESKLDMMGADTMACRSIWTPGPESGVHLCSLVLWWCKRNGTIPTGDEARKWGFCTSFCCPWHTPVRSQHIPWKGICSPLSSKLPFCSGKGSKGKCNSLPGQNFDLSSLV